jgi:hypothetical protein
MLKRFKAVTSMADEEGKIRIGEFVDIEKITLDELVRPKNED